MSTSFIYHALGLHGYDYVHQKFADGGITFRIRAKWQIVRCPVCGSRKVIRRGMVIRKLRTVPIGCKPVWLLVEIPRVFCCKCGAVRQIDTGISSPRRSYTRKFERFVITLSKVMTLKDIAAFVNVGWDCIKDIVKNNLLKRFSEPSLKNTRYIAIDEVSIRKGHKYLTLVLDIERGVVLFVGNGKGADALTSFWQRLGKRKKQILAVCTDMGPGYISAVLKNLPDTPLIFDRFHAVKLMNDTLSDIRRALHHELTDIMHKTVIKGTRWLLLKNPENLSTAHDEASKLKEALRLNVPLSTAYYMKEDLRQFWEQPDRDSAEKVIDDWINRAWSSGISPLVKMGTTIKAYKSGILNWYEHRISSGKMEGTNNKIKVLKRMAYGYRDLEFFKLRILAIHEARYAFTG